MNSQHSLGWYRDRLGQITGSNLFKLFTTSRAKGEVFGDTAKTYLYQLAAERAMNPVIIEDDDLFEEYIKQIDISTSAMRWGTEQESNARELYETITGNRIVEVGSCKHKTIPHFASSPDGYHHEDTKGCIEIKCPNQATYLKYKSLIKDNVTLFSVEPKYYYQCQAHQMCVDAEWCDFVVYNPFQLEPLHYVRIYPDEKIFKASEERIRLANEFIEEVNESITIKVL